MLWFPPLGRLFFITPDTVLFEEICSAVFWCIMDGGWLGAVPCGKMEESWGGRAAVADCFLLSPGALGISVMKRTECRSTVLCHASCYDLHELHAVHLVVFTKELLSLSYNSVTRHYFSFTFTSCLAHWRSHWGNKPACKQCWDELQQTKPREVLPRAFYKSVKKTHYWELLVRNLSNEHSLPSGQNCRTTEQSLLFLFLYF